MRSPVSLARPFAVCVAFVVSACGASPGGPTPGPTLTVGPVPTVLSTDLAVGQNRFVFGLLDGRTGRSVARPGEEVRVSFFELDRSSTAAAAEASGVFAWVEPKREGAYVASVELGSAGTWEAEVHPTGAVPTRVAFEVRERPLTPRIGAKVPASFTRTLRDVRAIGELTTDPKPARRFYQTSIREAVGAAIPFVVVFASPRHCSGSGCGHMLQVAKRVAAETTELTFVHVELYRDASSPRPQDLDPAVGEWGLPSDPWLFVVDASGRVTAKYERVVTVEELRAAVVALY